MGFFKDVGNKLKRVVSFKNVVRGVTGDLSGIGKDVQRVMQTDSPKKVNEKLFSVNNLTSKSYANPQPVNDFLENQDKIYKENLAKSVAETKAAQSASSFLSKVYLQSMWLKYKTWIIAGAVLLVGFLVWFFKFRKKHARKRSR